MALSLLRPEDENKTWWKYTPSEDKTCAFDRSEFIMFDQHVHWAVKDPEYGKWSEVVIWKRPDESKCLLEYTRTGMYEGCGKGGNPLYTLGQYLTPLGEMKMGVFTDDGEHVQVERMDTGPLRKNWQYGDVVQLNGKKSKLTWHVEIFPETRSGIEIGRGLRVHVPSDPKKRAKFIRAWNRKPTLIPLGDMVVAPRYKWLLFRERYDLPVRYDDAFIELPGDHESRGIYDPFFTNLDTVPLWYIANHEPTKMATLRIVDTGKHEKKKWFFKVQKKFKDAVEKDSTTKAEVIRLTWFYSEKLDTMFSSSSSDASDASSSGRGCHKINGGDQRKKMKTIQKKKDMDTAIQNSSSSDNASDVIIALLTLNK